MAFKQHTTEHFIEKARKKHGDFYNYDKSIYTGVSNKLIVTCPIHGDFKVKPSMHYYHNCDKCRAMNGGIKLAYSQEFIINKANEIHNYKYDYSELVYVNMFSKVTIICPEHGKFFQEIKSHLNGVCGCRKCSIQLRKGWSKTQWINFCKQKGVEEASIYFGKFEINGEQFIKVGITTDDIFQRYSAVKFINILEFAMIIGAPDIIFDLENNILKYYKEYKYVPKNKFGGQTECLHISIWQQLLSETVGKQSLFYKPKE